MRVRPVGLYPIPMRLGRVQEPLVQPRGRPTPPVDRSTPRRPIAIMGLGSRIPQPLGGNESGRFRGLRQGRAGGLARFGTLLMRKSDNGAMLSFAVYSNGRLADKVSLAGAYVVGSDDVPLRAEVSFKNGIVTCKKRAAGPAGLALLWDVPGAGTILLETIRVQERDKPYILQVELARGRLMRITHKLEEWGLPEYEGTEQLFVRFDQSRNLLIRALQTDHAPAAAALGDEALSLAVQVSEELSRFHASIFLARRKQGGGLGRRLFGCSAPLDKPTDTGRKRLAAAFDFVTLPIVWRDIEPTEQTFNWKPLDAWVEALAKQPIPLRGSALLSFHEKNVPDWLYIWEHDFDTIRDLAFEHVRRVINRYGQYIQTWNVACGLHANNCFTFSFEQLMELSRMATALTKQVCPRALAVLEIVAPWGEYYARNQRTIPPLLYADMAVQSGVNFDAFGLQFHFGPAMDGMYVRDMFQISCMLDLFGKLGRPLHITAVQVPSGPLLAKGEAGGGDLAPADGGSWHGPWSEKVQADWLRRFVEIALSKPFVETVSWHSLVDQSKPAVPHAGLVRSDLAPKAAYLELMTLRQELLGGGSRSGGDAGA